MCAPVLTPGFCVTSCYRDVGGGIGCDGVVCVTGAGALSHGQLASPALVSVADKVLLRRLLDKFSEAYKDWRSSVERQDDVTWKYFARSLVVLKVQVRVIAVVYGPGPMLPPVLGVLDFHAVVETPFRRACPCVRLSERPRRASSTGP